MFNLFCSTRFGQQQQPCPEKRRKKSQPAFIHSTQNQHGATLIVTLVMLVIVLMLSTSFAGMALMGEKAARNERDKQIAMHAAEAALADAEQDIENSTAATSRSAIFSSYSTEGFTDSCGYGDENRYQGLCSNYQSNQKTEQQDAWLTVDFSNTDTSSPSVQFGRFTGRTMPFGVGPFPSQLPRYIIELMLDHKAGKPTNAVYMYRITAVGFGTDSATQIVLQSFYRKT